MSRKVFLDAFYGQFSDFLEQLMKAFPEDDDFPAYKMGLNLLKRTNPILVPEQVNIHVTPFEEKINARDETFIVNYEFSEYSGDDALAMIIGKMRERWTVLSDHNKKVIWDYTVLLLNLAKRCCAS
jgi:hypothetical protein